MAASVPAIEIADHTDPLSVWREYHERHAFDLVDIARVRSELIIDAKMIAFAEKVQVEIRKNGGKR